MSQLTMNSSDASAFARRPPFGFESAGLPAIVTSAHTCPSPGVSVSSARHATGSSPNTSGSPLMRLPRRPKRTPLPRPGTPRVLTAPAAAFVNIAPPSRSRWPGTSLQRTYRERPYFANDSVGDLDDRACMTAAKFSHAGGADGEALLLDPASRGA